MNEFISLNWEKQQLAGLDAEVEKGNVRVHRCFQLSWPPELNPAAEPDRAGEWLKGELDQLGIRSRQVLISLPREDVAVRQLDVPDIADEKLPDVVYLQAETKVSSSLDRIVLDFLPLPKLPDANVRQVLLVTIARERIEELRSIVKAAGRELVSVGISPAATAELVAHVESIQNADTKATTLYVKQQEQQLEITLMRQQHVLFSHYMHLSAENGRQDSQPILAEIRRALGAHSRMDADPAVSRAWVIDSQDKSKTLCGLMAEFLSCEVGTIDPLSDASVQYLFTDPPGDHSMYAGPLGMLLSQSCAVVEKVDFLNPRKSVVPTDRRVFRAGLVAAMVVSASILAYGGSRWRLSRIDTQLDKTQQELTRLAEAVKKGKPTLDAAGLIVDWDKHNIDWLSQMTELNEILQGTDRIYLADYRFSPPSGADASLGRIQAAGFARSRRDVEQLYQRLAERNFRVLPHEISDTSKDADYPYRFQLDLVKTKQTEPKNLAANEQSATP